MKRRVHQLPYLAVLAAGALALAACGSSGSASSATTTSSNQAGPAAFSVSGKNCPSAATKPLAKGADIVIGSTLPRSGIAAEAGIAVSGIEAYFQKVNATGGIDGHQLRFDPKDDALNTARAVTNVKQLTGQEHVFATLYQVGTSGTKASQPIYEQTCTPQLYAVGTDASMTQPRQHPWSVAYSMPAQLQANMIVSYLKQQFPQGATLGVLEGQGGWQTELLANIHTAINGTNIKIVASEDYAPTATSISSQMVNILAKNPDAIFGAVDAHFCPQLPQATTTASYHGKVILSWICSNIASFLKPIGAAANGVIIAEGIQDPADTQVNGSSGIQTYLGDMKQYEPSANANSAYTLNGYTTAELLVQNLRAASTSKDGLSRLGLMNAAWHTNVTVPYMVGSPNVVINVDHPYFPGSGELGIYSASPPRYTKTGISATL